MANQQAPRLWTQVLSVFGDQAYMVLFVNFKAREGAKGLFLFADQVNGLR
jgi:hypothetical protein